MKSNRLIILVIAVLAVLAVLYVVVGNRGSDAPPAAEPTENVAPSEETETETETDDTQS